MATAIKVPELTTFTFSGEVVIDDEEVGILSEQEIADRIADSLGDVDEGVRSYKINVTEVVPKK